jgi:hypothetical protein
MTKKLKLKSVNKMLANLPYPRSLSYHSHYSIKDRPFECNKPVYHSLPLFQKNIEPDDNQIRYCGGLVNDLIISINKVVGINGKGMENYEVGELFLADTYNLCRLVESINDKDLLIQNKSYRHVDTDNILIEYFQKMPHLSDIGWITPIQCIYHEGMINLGKKMLPVFILMVFQHSSCYPLSMIKKERLEKIINKICILKIDHFAELLFSHKNNFQSKISLLHGLFGLFIYDLVTTKKIDMFNANITKLTMIVRTWFNNIFFETQN